MELGGQFTKQKLHNVYTMYTQGLSIRFNTLDTVRKKSEVWTQIQCGFF